MRLLEVVNVVWKDMLIGSRWNQRDDRVRGGKTGTRLVDAVVIYSFTNIV